MDPSSKTREIFRQNTELRDRLQFEQSSYRKKMDLYQQSQQQQSQLVKKLQDKVLQYKAKSMELENKVRTMDDGSKRMQLHEITDNLNKKMENSLGSKQNTECLLLQLEEEDSRNNDLKNLNCLLREKLDQSSEANQQLTQKVEGLSRELKETQTNGRNQENEFSHRERSMESRAIEEHNNMVMLWRDVSELRKNLENSRTESEREISRGKSEINKIMTNINDYFTNQKIKKQNNEECLKKEIDYLRGRVNQQVSEIEEREERQANCMELDNQRRRELAENERQINSLRSNMARLESENEALHVKRNDESKRERDETEALHSSLRRIAASALSDADSASECKNDHFSGNMFSTQSAIVAALDKKQQQIVDLRAKVTTSKEKNQTLENLLNDAANAERAIQREVSNLKTENETLRRDMDFVSHDKEKAKNLLEKKNVDYSQLEITKKNLNERIDRLSSELEQMQVTNTDLGRSKQLLQVERDDNQREHDRQLRENERCRLMIDRLENSHSSLKDELLNFKDQLNKVQLDKEVVENQKKDQQQGYEKLEKEHVDCANELRKTKYEKSNMADTISEQNSSIDIIEREKNNLNKFINQLENEKVKLQCEKNELEKEKWNMREEIISSEQDKAELHNNLNSFKEQLQYSNFENEKIESDMLVQIKEKGELLDQFKILTKQKNYLTEDLTVARNDVSKHQESCGRLNKDKEQLNKLNSTLNEQLRSLEKEHQQQKEYIAGVKAEKSSLESSMYDLQQQNAMLSSKKDQLEAENQEISLRKEALNNELSKTMKEKEFSEQSSRQEFDQYKQKSVENEKQLRQTIELSSQAHEEDTEFFVAEQERIRREFDLRCNELIGNSSDELEQVIKKYSNQIESMKEEMTSLKQENENALSSMQTQKQEIVSKMEEDAALLQQRLKNLTEESEQISQELSRLKYDYSNLQGWSEQTIKGLENDISKLRNDLTETCEENSRVNAGLTKTKNDFANFKERSNQEAIELTNKIEFLSEENHNLKLEISDLTDKISNQNDDKKALANDITILKRSLAEESSEKEMKIRANNELFDKLRNTESEKSEMNRSLTDCKTKITSLKSHVDNSEAEIEGMRTNLKNSESQKTHIDLERQQLAKELKHISYEMEQLTQEKENLNSMCIKYDEKDTNSRKEIANYKQKVSDVELNKELLVKDLDNLQNKLKDYENMIRDKDYECQMTLNDLNSTEKRLNQDKERLDETLEAAKDEINDLRMEISCRDGRLNVLENQISTNEANKNKLARKLDVICTAIRRSIGVEPSNTELRTRSISPRRPARERSCSFDKSAEVDENIFRTAVITVSERLARAEKDRDEFQAQLTFTTSDLSEVSNNCHSLEDRVGRMQKYTIELEKEKSELEIRLANVQTSISVQEEGVRKLEKEKKGSLEKINNLESANLQNESEKRTINEKLNRIKANEQKLETEAGDLKQNLDNVLSKLACSERIRNKMEDNLKRCKGLIQSRSEEIECAQNKNAKQVKAIEEYERKCTALNCSIDKLNTTISKLEEESVQNQEKNSKLSSLLIEYENKLEMSHERIASLHKDLSDCDSRKNLLQQKINATESQLAKLKRENKEFIDKADKSNFSVRECKYTIGEMESQIHQYTQLLSFQEQEKQKNVHQLRCAEEFKEKLENQMKDQVQLVAALGIDKKQLENSLNSSEKENETLRRKIKDSENEKLETEDKLKTTISAQNTYNRVLQNLEFENVDLQRQVGDLQIQLNQVDEAYSHRMFELSTKKHMECENEVQKLLNAQNDTAKMLTVKERINKQKVRSLQQQVDDLKQELSSAKRR